MEEQQEQQKKQENERLPLVENNPSPRSEILCRKILHYSACAIAAGPTAWLSGFAMYTGYEKQLGELDSLSEFTETMESYASVESIIGALAVFIGAEAVLTFMNSRYFFPALETVGRLFYNLLKREGISLHQWFIFLWTFFASLAFGEIGALLLKFLSFPGEMISFFFMFVVYFATRHMSGIYFLQNIFDKNERIKKQKLASLQLFSLYDLKTAVVVEREGVMLYGNKVNASVLVFLQHMEKCKKSLMRQVLYYGVNIPISMLLVIFTGPMILSSFLPPTIQGWNRLTRGHCGEESRYQDPGSLTFGSFAALLTLIFYAMSIYDFLWQLITTLFEVVNRCREGDWLGAMMLLTLTLTIGGASFTVGLAFRLVALTAAVNDFGWFGILPEWFAALAPDGMLLAVTLMLWAHLQELTNHRFCK